MPLRKWLRRKVMWASLRVAQRYGFPFQSLTVTHHHPLAWGGDPTPPPPEIDLVWRGNRYYGPVTREPVQ